MNKPFLKWPGGKYRLVDKIVKQLGEGKRLVEPFVGSGAVFLNTEFKRYLLADNNPHLISVYNTLKQEQQSFINDCKRLFNVKNNHADKYYELREEFNTSQDEYRKTVLFVYLNRHCYNGLIRYNSKQIFNTPFGRYIKPYFPEQEMNSFIQQTKKAKFIHASFVDTMKQVRTGDVVYCDPPYVPLSKTASFTQYSAGGFDWQDQQALSEWAEKLANKGINVIISNHNTRDTKKLYRNAGAKVYNFEVRRNISCNANQRNKAPELLAVFA